VKILVTGADGFVGKNLCVRLGERAGFECLRFTRRDDESALRQMLAEADLVIHLAGENRPADPADFETVNAGLTQKICEILIAGGRDIPLIFASSAQAELDNPYGQSKRRGELAVADYASATGAAAAIYRLPNLFGKWCRPNYNSVVATFCHNIAKGQDIVINNPDTPLRLAYIDDVIAEFIRYIDTAEKTGLMWGQVSPEYATTVGAIAAQLRGFADSRASLTTDRVGAGFTRALYSTYLSYLQHDDFAYDVVAHGDPRGIFVEMLKTPDCGQFSYFTAHPGITRGGHYHHSKTEKFLVINGKAEFRFRHIITGEHVSLETAGGTPRIVETIPGWSHDITNIGEEELVVMLWANEIFDAHNPDTIASIVVQ
jgi:UDP-2-acetamido-2,6-beta-L-arabino-hexul-4-ose reductase